MVTFMTVTHSDRLAAEQIPNALESVLRKRIPGAENATIANWKASAQGFSTETYLFDLVGVRSGDMGLVFRRPPDFDVLPDFDLRRQFLVMQRLAATAVPVPAMRYIDADGVDLGTPYFLMDRIDDVVCVSDVPSYHQTGVYAETDHAGRATLWNGCVDLIAAVHQVELDSHRFRFCDLRSFGSTPPQRLSNFLRYAVNWASGANPIHPRFSSALDWLDRHLYVPDRVTLCWGDSRMSNVLYGNDYHPVAAMDWELAYLGDPGADVAWMFMSDWISSPLAEHACVPGTPSRDETIERYERATGHRLSNMIFNDVTAALLLAVPLIRLNEKLRLDGVDLADICAQRIDFVLKGD
jgi:aminoglycoside phosphotransferase (APT) family kinase protein